MPSASPSAEGRGSHLGHALGDGTQAGVAGGVPDLEENVRRVVADLVERGEVVLGQVLVNPRHALLERPQPCLPQLGHIPLLALQVLAEVHPAGRTLHPHLAHQRLQRAELAF
eukprot:1180497-Prorocentrum_minimum.AAC.7